MQNILFSQEIFLTSLKLLLMAQKLKDNRPIGEQIKDHFTNQAWLAAQTGISEAQLSRKMKGKIDWTQQELDAINKVLGTNFKL